MSLVDWPSVSNKLPGLSARLVISMEVVEEYLKVIVIHSPVIVSSGII